jgi:heat-inducible transcriptional repressor
MDNLELSEREKTILRYVIHQFILTANPVGSRNITKRYDIGLSPATVRNIMADLEELGLLNHPHTSAGRVPTDLGYRFYVDSLMDPPRLTSRDRRKISEKLDESTKETDELLRATAYILSDLTSQLACVTYPKFEHAILQKIQLVSISSNRMLVVVSIKSGLVKTITLEINSKVKLERISEIERIFNERLSGLSFAEIRNSFEERIKDYYNDDFKPVIRVFLKSLDKIFTDIKINDKSVLIGASNILNQPEFGDYQHLSSVIELIENKDIIIHIMDSNLGGHETDLVNISIGMENQIEKLTDYSLVTKKYKLGSTDGTLGIVGPKRMDYSKIIATVVYVADILSEEFKKQTL